MLMTVRIFSTTCSLHERSNLNLSESLLINGKPTKNSQTFEELQSFLNQKPKFWPINFETFVPRSAVRDGKLIKTLNDKTTSPSEPTSTAQAGPTVISASSSEDEGSPSPPRKSISGNDQSESETEEEITCRARSLTQRGPVIDSGKTSDLGSSPYDHSFVLAMVFIVLCRLFPRPHLSTEEVDALFNGPKLRVVIERPPSTDGWGFGVNPG